MKLESQVTANEDWHGWCLYLLRISSSVLRVLWLLSSVVDIGSVCAARA